MHIHHLDTAHRTAILLAAHDLAANYAYSSAMEERAFARGRGPEDPETQQREDAAAAESEARLNWHNREIGRLRDTISEEELAGAIAGLAAAKEGSPLLLGAQEYAWHACAAAGLSPAVEAVELHTFGEGWLGRPRVWLGVSAPTPTEAQLRAAHRLARERGDYWSLLDLDSLAGRTISEIADLAAHRLFAERSAEADRAEVELDLGATHCAIEAAVLSPEMDSFDRLLVGSDVVDRNGALVTLRTIPTLAL